MRVERSRFEKSGEVGIHRGTSNEKGKTGGSETPPQRKNEDKPRFVRPLAGSGQVRGCAEDGWVTDAGRTEDAEAVREAGTMFVGAP